MKDWLIYAWRWGMSFRFELTLRLGVVMYYETPIFPLLDVKLRFYRQWD